MRSAGAQISTASTSLGTAIGADGGEAKVDNLIENLKVDEFAAVFFVGGPGCLKYLDIERSYNLAKEVVAKERVLGAICISPVILAKAGVLQGKKATVWSSAMDKSAIKILEENGATYQDEGVVVDGKIVTANGPASARAFGEILVEVLTKQHSLI